MRKIYFQNRCIIICEPSEPALSDPNSVEFHIDEHFNIHTLVDMFEAGESLSRIYIPTDEPELMYRKLCAEFVEVDAAGGLVVNKRGDYLLINRNGLWDLPKGHREEGEDIELTAIREVQEETGVENLELNELICITDHCYIRDDKWFLKHTYWYNMLYTDPVELSPQREEDITKATWIARSSLPPYIKNSYPSIMEVFRKL